MKGFPDSIKESANLSARSSLLTKKDQSERLYQALDFLQVRAPLLPVEAYLDLQSPTNLLHESLSAQNPAVLRALAVGSLALLDEVERSSTNQRDSARRDRKLLRYIIRMATRPTPYGLFAGVALADWAEQTELSLADAPPSLHTRPDMEWVMSLVWQLEQLPDVQKHLSFIANTAAYTRRGRIFLLEQLPGGKSRATESVSIRATGAATRAFALARHPIPYIELVDALLASTPGATLQKVQTLISTLWQQTLLLTDLRPPLTTASPIHYLAHRLETIPPAASIHRLIEDYLEMIEVWDASEMESGTALYRSLLEKAAQIEDALAELVQTYKGQDPDLHLPAAGSSASQAKKKPSTQPKRSSTLLQVDMALQLAGKHVARAVGEEAAAAAELLLMLSPLPTGYRYLETYRQAFVERYGLQREVSLLELLDPQFGLGIPAMYTSQPQHAHETASFSSARDQSLLRLALSALHNHQPVRLDQEMLRSLETCSPSATTAPPSLDIYAFVVADSAQAINQGRFQIVIGPNIGAMQAGRNLGRFAALLGSDAIAALQHPARSEARHTPGSILAELVYLPRESRIANVVVRPPVCSHEILYGVTPGVAHSQVIPMDELVIGVRNERFYCRWLPRNTDVIIQAGHMLNSIQAPAVVRFLSDLSHDGIVQLSGFDWGSVAGFPFLPRVETGRIILSLAQWRINSTFHLDEFMLDTPERFQASLSRWRERWDVPQYVYLSEGDNRLLLDLECPTQAEELRVLMRQFKDGQQILLQEGVPGPAHAWLEGPGGHYLTEFVVSLALRRTQPDMPVPPIDGAASNATPPEPLKRSAIRLCPPGSEWLFMKLYCPQALQDELIAGPVRLFAQDALVNKFADEWFFLRYADPDPHLRLRFRGEPEVLVGKLLPALCSWGTHLMSDGPCLSFSFDVYDREIERYGGPVGISQAELLFAVDSRAVADLLQLLRAGVVQMDRIVLAVLTTNDLLTHLGLTQAMRLQWCREAVPTPHAAGASYRQKSSHLRSLLGNPTYLATVADGEQIAKLLTRRRTVLAQVSQRLSDAASQGMLNQQPELIYRSFVHLHCNRMLGIDQAAEKEVLELLLRTLDGLERAPVRATPA